MSTKSNLLKNGFANTLQKGIRALEQLFLVPFFIASWGAEYYGEWLTLTIIPSVLSFSDLGFGTAAANSIVLRYVSGDKVSASNMAKSSIFITTIVVLVGIVLTVIILFVLLKLGFLNKSLIAVNEAIVAVSCLMLTRLFNFYQQLFEAYFRCERKASLSIQLLNIFSVSNLLVGMIVLSLGGNIIEYSASILLISISFNPLYAYFGIKIINFGDTRLSKISKVDVIETFKKGTGYMLSPIWQAIYFQGTTFVVRIVIGPTAVAVFNTVRTLSRSGNQLFSIVNGSVFPELQYKIGMGEYSGAKKLFSNSILITILISLVGMIFLSLFGVQFYHFWTNNALSISNFVWYTFVISIGFNSLWFTASMVFRAYNQPYMFAISGFFASIISVIFTYILSLNYGLAGAAIGALLLDVLLSIYVIPKSLKILNLSFKEMIGYISIRSMIKKL